MMNENKPNYSQHIQSICIYTNTLLSEKNINIRFDIDAIKYDLKGRSLNSAKRAFEQSIEDHGVLHENQMQVLSNTILEILNVIRDHEYLEPNLLRGLILGAMQSGKTTASFTLQWLGPMLYLLTGYKFYPFHLLTNQESHESQTQAELTYFLRYYGWLPLIKEKSGDKITLDEFMLNRFVDEEFSDSADLDSYREAYLKRHQFADILSANLLLRRVPGKNVTQMELICQEAIKLDLIPLILIDEPQWGSTKNSKNQPVLKQMFDKVNSVLGQLPHAIIGLSATPFEIYEQEDFFKIHMPLPDSYLGFNFIRGKAIDPKANVKNPLYLCFSEFASLNNMGPLDFNVRGWKNYEDESLPKKLSSLINKIISMPYNFFTEEGDGVPRGICIRAVNNNEDTKRLVRELNLDSDKVEILGYYDQFGKGMSVKQMLAERKSLHLPFIVFVTSKARLGDAFPKQVDYFIDLTRKTTNFNALLQGIVGRACGHGKKSTILLSEDNFLMLDAYVKTKGKTHGKYSNGTENIKTTSRKGRYILMVDFKSKNIKDNPNFNALYNDLCWISDKYIFKPGLMKDLRSSILPSIKGKKLPIASKLIEHKIFDILRSSTNLTSRHIGNINPVLPGETMPDNSVKDGYSIYEVDENNNCFVNIRVQKDMTKVGTKRRYSNKIPYGIYAPTLGFEKVDENGNVVNNDQLGYWKLRTLALPLKEPIKEVIESEESLSPTEESVWHPDNLS